MPTTAVRGGTAPLTSRPPPDPLPPRPDKVGMKDIRETRNRASELEEALRDARSRMVQQQQQAELLLAKSRQEKSVVEVLETRVQQSRRERPSGARCRLPPWHRRRCFPDQRSRSLAGRIRRPASDERCAQHATQPGRSARREFPVHSRRSPSSQPE